ncbi:MAG: helix-turn-helix transcriptional regulator [Oscillospiraceae bacterium]|nr:helix-turn-helix transcriptional regulator [Oscillospiraceae bacterium]
MTNSKLLKEKIKQIGLTQAKVADLIEISPCSISNKINGTRDFTVNEMSTLCEILKIDDKTSVFFA